MCYFLVKAEHNLTELLFLFDTPWNTQYFQTRPMILPWGKSKKKRDAPLLCDGTFFVFCSEECHCSFTCLFHSMLIFPVLLSGVRDHDKFLQSLAASQRDNRRLVPLLLVSSITISLTFVSCQIYLCYLLIYNFSRNWNIFMLVSMGLFVVVLCHFLMTGCSFSCAPLSWVISQYGTSNPNKLP